MLTWGDGSWKWFIGIPDGLFAAIHRLRDALPTRAAASRGRGRGLDGAEADTKKGVFAALTTPFRNARRRRKEKKQAEAAPAPVRVPER